MMVSTNALTATRESLHRLAEHVVSPCRHAQTGRIGLRPHPRGLQTPPFGPEGEIVAVDLDELVIIDAAGERRTKVSSLRAAGNFAGIAPGAPADVYSPATPCELDAPLTLDVDAMRVLAGWYALGASALAELAARTASESPSEAQLWPEHLDLAMTVGSVNYGFSPGDAARPEPYVYVGPHAGRPTDDDFWNADFGAARPAPDIADAAAAVAFFDAARERLSATALTTERATS